MLCYRPDGGCQSGSRTNQPSKVVHRCTFHRTRRGFSPCCMTRSSRSGHRRRCGRRQTAAWADAARSTGVYVSDVRVLGSLAITVGGGAGETIATLHDDASTLRFVAVHRELDGPGADPDTRATLTRVVRPDGVSHTLELASRLDHPVTTEVVAVASAELTPMEAVRAGGARPAVPRGRSPTETRVRWSGDDMTATLHAPGATIETGDEGGIRMSWPVEVPARGSATVGFDLVASTPLPSSRRQPRRHPWAAPDLAGADDRLVRWVDRALGDLDALRLVSDRSPGDQFFAAGAPWFFTLFGRDSIWAARLLLPLGPDVARGTLRVLAALQGRDSIPETAEQPGKIMHELRTGGGVAREGPHAARRSTTARRRHAALDLPARRRARCRPARRRRPRAAAEPRGGARLDARLRRQRRGRAARVRRRDRAPGCRTRAGRTAATRCSGATARWPTARSRSARCRRTPTRRRCAARNCSTRSVATAATSGGRGRCAWRRASARRSGSMTPTAPTRRSRSTPASGPVDTVTSNIGPPARHRPARTRSEAALVARRLGSPELDSGLRAAHDVDRLRGLLAAVVPRRQRLGARHGDRDPRPRPRRVRRRGRRARPRGCCAPPSRSTTGCRSCTPGTPRRPSPRPHRIRPPAARRPGAPPPRSRSWSATRV